MENRKSQIIELALRNIREKGYLSFSYDDLAKELGVTKASIHYHFMKKEDLGLAVCTKLKEGLEKSYLNIDQAQINSEDKPWEFISRRANQIGNNEVCPISSLQADYNFLPIAMQESVQQLSQMEIDYLKKLLDVLKEEGKLTHDTGALAALLISSIKGALQYRRVVGEYLYSIVIDQLKLLVNGNDGVRNM
ncbi:TetR/AcrR family transcriptional regulator [Sporosarcina sp. FSL K6-1540]|uniref:TetR/AcrR family transcriptional regulator n=1 Tax=Sporosarcina TaxID=1569 RepID=UPI00078D62CA|nr:MULTISPECIES: TetR/AcrR family transcriptional regulator [Sporosarcina]AMQ08470.1 TetR family transcriptional regulator [Sporosarcina psychrophila]QNK89620.1 TetR/AcrR family transcriptional regulator [Sporosarcina sp. resist]